MNISKTASSGIFKIVEKIIRSHPLIYYILRYFVRFTNIFEEDAKGVKFLNFKDKVNIIDVGASDGIATKFFCKNLNVNKVFCYEPNMSYVKILRKLEFSNVKIYPYGISNKKSNHQVFLPRYSFFKNNGVKNIATLKSIRKLKIIFSKQIVSQKRDFPENRPKLHFSETI